MPVDIPPQDAKFQAAYQALEPPEQILALAFGAAFPHALTQYEMYGALRRVRFRLNGRLIVQASYHDAWDAAWAAGMFFDTGDGEGFVACEDWVPWLTLEAQRQGILYRLENSLSYFIPTSDYWNIGAEDAEMIVRNSVMTGQFDQIRRKVRTAPPGAWRWLAHPAMTDLLGKVPEAHIDGAYRDCFRQLVRKAEAPEPVMAAYAASPANRAMHAGDRAMLEVMRGAFDKALAAFDQLAEDDRAAKSARSGRASIRALMALLRGDDVAAFLSIDEAIECERDGTRKRNVLPEHPAFMLALLALVRGHTPALAAKLDHLFYVAGRRELESPFLDVVRAADSIRRSGECSQDSPVGAASIEWVLEGLVSCWMQAFPGPAGKERFSALLEFGVKADRNGYRWLAAECFEICTQWWRAGRRKEAGFEEMLARRLGREAKGPLGIAADMHRELGTKSLASLIRPKAQWEYALKKIELVASETKGKAGKDKPKGSATERRLAWFLEIDDHGRFDATAKVQRGYRNGKWSKGQKVSLKRLQENRAEMEFLTDRDRAAAGEIGQTFGYSYARPDYYLTASGLYELAGHPYVFNQDGGPVEIVRLEPELLVQERKGTLRVQVSPHLDAENPRDYLVRVASDMRIEVTRFNAEHKKLCKAIPAEGIELPSEARDRLIGAVSALSEDVRVQGLISGATAAAEQIEGDPRPWVRLEPRGPGLVATLLVEPVPESGIYFQPGAGGTATFATVAGRALHARRVHAAETRAVRELTQACPILAGAGPDLSLVVPDPGDCIELVDQLDAAGARCLWPGGQPFRVVARADAGSLRLRVKSAADWFSASGTLRVDEDRVIKLRRLFELLDQNPSSRFIPVSEGAFVALTASFRRQLEDLRSLSAPGGKKSLRIHGLAALSLREFFDDTQLSADDDWSDLGRRFDDAKSYEPGIPGTLQAELRPYQEDGFRWLARLGRWGVGACLADDMGLGKTVQALALMLNRAPGGAALVVAPTSVVDNWLGEARRFAPTLNVRTYTGPAPSRARHLEDLGPFDVVVTTYGILHIDAEALGAVDWDTVVLDEAQAIRNPATKRARAARRLKARFRIVTTGTPIQNNLGDLYSLFAFLNPGMLGSQKHFRQKFDLPIAREGDPAARSRLRRLISPFVLRRVKADVLDDLPPRTEVTLHVEMSPEESALYEALRRRAMKDLEALSDENASQEAGAGPDRRRFQVLAHLTRLRLACCNARLVQPDGPPSSKLRTFASTLDELRKGRHKVLVFSQFVRHLKLIEEHLVQEKIPYQYLDGSTPPKARSKRIAAFQAGDGDAFLISLKAGGVGLNLTAADYVIHMDPWWNPAAEDQASDRAHRIGQTRPVTIYRLVTKGTIEEQIVELHHTKRELADRLLEGADSPSRLSMEELLKLLRG